MRYVLFIFLFLTCISCAMDTGENTPEPLFAIPTVIEETDTEAQSQPLVSQPNPVVPIVDKPEDAKVPNRVFDILAPQLIESTIRNSKVDPNTDVISLRFNEDIAEIDIKLVDNSDVSMRWIPSIDIITGRRIFLTRVHGGDPKVSGRSLGSGRTYYIKGFVEDKVGNKKSIDIEFRAVDENRDRSAPVVLTASIWHGATNVSTNTDQIVFTFNEDIANAEARLVRGHWQTGTDMRWSRFIDKKEVVLVKITGKSLSLRNNSTYAIVLKASDASGNSTPPGNNVWVYEFTTQR